MKKSVLQIWILVILAGACNKNNSEQRETTGSMNATQIINKVYEIAGGKTWLRPNSLSLFGHARFYKNGKVSNHEKHSMYRVFEHKKAEAHAANGKVRIESYKQGEAIVLLSYDGKNTYDINGRQEQSEADERWASNFGFGVIRHALDPGYKVSRLNDTIIRELHCYQIKILDLKKKETQFAIDKSNFHIVNVAFETPRGWHERIYSKYFTKKEYTWLQSGQVELYYNNIKTNEVFWTDFDINQDLPDSLFILK